MRWIIILALVGFALIAHGCKESKLNSLAKAEPQTITLAELESGGYGENAHVVLADFLFLDWDFVYAERKGSWTEAWVPAVPLGGEFHGQLESMFDEDGNWPMGLDMPVPDRIPMIVKLPSARSTDDVVAAGERDTLQGLIVNDIDKLGSEERGLLASSYPGIDFRQCMILEVGRSRTGGGLVFASLLGGLACIGGAGYMVWRGFQSRPAAKTKRRRAARSKRRSIDPPDAPIEP